MNEKQFIKVFRLAKAALILVLVYFGFRAITGHLHFGSLDPAVVSGDEHPTEAPTPARWSQSPSDYKTILQGNLFSGSDDAAGLGIDVQGIVVLRHVGVVVDGVLGDGPGHAGQHLADPDGSESSCHARLLLCARPQPRALSGPGSR